MSKKTLLFVSGATVLGILWWKYASHDEREMQRAVRKMRDRAVTLGACVAEALEHAAMTLDDIGKVVHTVAHTVDRGVRRVA